MKGSWPQSWPSGRWDALYDKLLDVFDADCHQTQLHRFVERLSRRTGESPESHACMLLMTTNYDDSLERALQEAREPHDLVIYIADVRNRGVQQHQHDLV